MMNCQMKRLLQSMPIQRHHAVNADSKALSWSFYMNFMKLAKGSFHKFHMK